MLRPGERDKLRDCLLLIQSARRIITGLAGHPKLSHLSGLELCFQDADRAISELLRG
jgi:hypothetical protein